MPVITVFNGTCCSAEEVVGQVQSLSGYRLIEDPDLIRRAAEISGLDEDKIGRAFSAKTSVFNKFTYEKERSIAWLKQALAELLSEDNLIVSGFSGRLIPEKISHVLRVCLIADIRYRISEALGKEGLAEKEAMKLIRRSDEDRAAWILLLHGKKDPWDSALYDMVFPMDKVGVTGAVELIVKNVKKDVVQPTAESTGAVSDFRLEALTEVALRKEGHDVGVEAKNGSVILTINKHVLMLGRLKEELRAIASGVPGVQSVEARVGKDFHQANIYRRYDFEAPSKVLLVDDERDFVQTLSERLIMRDMGSAVAYDGESALNLIKEDEPEVMILDLKMPGIDGMEVLKRVKETRPSIEVIILTGHGSDEDRKRCMELGAFAYMHKPVDIEVLSDTLRKANEKMRKKKEEKRANRE